MPHPPKQSVASVLTMLLALLIAASATDARAQAVAVDKLTDQPDEWFKSDEGRRVVDNIVSWQNPNGGWWKEYDASKPRPADASNQWGATSTFDNDATHSEMRILARAVRLLGDERYKQAFERGLNFILEAQYPNGGWPQRYPLENNYGRHITFNDGAMVRVMRVLKDTADGEGDFAFVSETDRRRAREAFDRGIECILKCQIELDGKLTAWCAQHHAETLEPVLGRSYELPSISGGESADVLVMLMEEIEEPDARMRNAIESAVAWYESAKITGKRIDDLRGPQYEGGRDRVMVDDPNAPPIWARFYDLKTGQPFVCDRDGIPTTFDKLSPERRVGYAWYGRWGDKVEKAYEKWKKRVS